MLEQWILKAFRNGETIRITYANGNSLFIMNGIICIDYSNGDQIEGKLINDQLMVDSVFTHDDIVWNREDEHQGSE